MLTLVSCTNQETPKEQALLGYQKYIKEFGFHSEDRINKIILITPYTICASCLQEINYYNTMFISGQLDTEPTLIVIERFEAPFNQYVELLNLSFSTMQDSTLQFLQTSNSNSFSVVVKFDSIGTVYSVHDLGTFGKIR
jgi:hypothetical protein